MPLSNLLTFFRSVWAWERFTPALDWTRIRDIETGRFVSLADASRSVAMTRYWARIRKIASYFPEESIDTIRRRWAARDYTDEELEAHGTSWEDLYNVSPKVKR